MWLRYSMCAAAVAALVAGSVVPAGASQDSTHRFSIKLVGIERDGRRTPVDAIIYGRNYIPIFTSGKPVKVPAGPAWIGTGINTTGSGGQILSTTLVLRRVTISRDATVTLDARPGKRVSFSLAVGGASDTGDNVQACVGGSFVPGAPVTVGGPPGSLYEVPVRSSDVTFGYASTWQDPAAMVLMAGQRRGGMPARPHFAARLTSMARIRLAFRAGTAVGGYSQLQLESNGSCAVQGGEAVSAGERLTQYVSAGTWEVTAYGYRSFWETTRRYSARHSYGDTFGAAVWGPGTGLNGYQPFPSVSASRLYFGQDDPIDDPLQNSSVCCDVSSITLSERHHVIKHSVMSQLGNEREFSASVPASAVYTLREISKRRVPGVKVPADILSPRVSVVWRFHAAPLPDTNPNSFIPPLSTAQFRAAGLNLQNQAPSLGTTPLTMTLSWPARQDFEIYHRHRLTEVRLQVSVNGGQSWHAVRLVRHGRSWRALVHDPASGYVSLRSTVTDSAGNRTVQTIDRAYQVG
jgi:hypothetical protein